MERDYDDAANTGVYIAGAIADAKTIADLREQLTAATARAEKAEALYAKAWAECEYWRDASGSIIDGKWHNDEYVGCGNYNNHAAPTADAHDAARREAGL